MAAAGRRWRLRGGPAPPGPSPGTNLPAMVATSRTENKTKFGDEMTWGGGGVCVCAHSFACLSLSDH